MIAIVASVILVVLIGFAIWYLTSQPSSNGLNLIIPGSQEGNIEITHTNFVPPRSFNEKEGLTFSYTGWLLVRDFTVGYGKSRRIFSKGDCPGMYIDSTSNSLVFKIDTYGSTETILISNMPALKWIHFGIVVDQSAVDIYINGTLRQHHTLQQLPKQNDQPIMSGPGWDGVLARLMYQPRSLSNSEIRKLSQEDVPDDLQREASKPNYFDITWYTGRLNSV